MRLISPLLLPCSYPMKSSTSRSSYGRMDSGADDGECLGCVRSRQLNSSPVERARWS